MLDIGIELTTAHQRNPATLPARTYIAATNPSQRRWKYGGNEQSFASHLLKLYVAVTSGLKHVNEALRETLVITCKARWSKERLLCFIRRGDAYICEKPGDAEMA